MKKIHLFFSSVLLVASTLLLVTACSDDDSLEEALGSKVQKVKLAQNTMSMVVGMNEQLVATIFPENAENQNVTWSSSKPEIADVDSTGMLWAKEVGSATIMVKTEDGEKVDFCLVTLTPAPILVSEIRLSESTLVLKKGESLTLIPIIIPENATNQTVTWTSSNPSVLSVDENGNVSALEFGNATLTVTTEDGGKTATCAVTADNKGSLRVETVEIPAGTFQMGVSGIMEAGAGTQPDERPAHQVTLSQGFKMSKYEITNEQFCFFLNAKGIGVDGVYNGKTMIISSEGQASDWGVHYNGTEWEPAAGYENFPVIYVTWYGAAEFAAFAGGSLPTEAQWEYACRGGIEDKPFGLGNGMSLTKNLANFNWMMECENGNMAMNGNTSSTSTVAVDSYTPNAFGLYNMHGNVREWCSDWYAVNYTAEGVTDPTGADSGTYRVFRGGSWGDMYIFCRCAFRNITNPMLSVKPEQGNDKTGFRIVMPL